MIIGFGKQIAYREFYITSKKMFGYLLSDLRIIIFKSFALQGRSEILLGHQYCISNLDIPRIKLPSLYDFIYFKLRIIPFWTELSYGKKRYFVGVDFNLIC